MSIEELVSRTRTLKNCTVHPPKGLPRINEGHKYLKGLKDFMNFCGGITLFEDAPYSVRIVPPDEVRQITPILWAEKIMEGAEEGFSYDDVMIPKLSTICGEQLKKSYNAVILLYNFQYVGDKMEATIGSSHFEFLALTEYQ